MGCRGSLGLFVRYCLIRSGIRENGRETTPDATALSELDEPCMTSEPDTDTATPDEQDTDTAMPDTDTPTSTPTSTPGFGVIVALTALLAAALLVVRRES